MATSTMIAAFQTINAGIAGIVSAPTAMPDDMLPDKMPCLLTLPGGAIWHAGAGIGMGRYCRRTYHLRCFVAPDTEVDIASLFATIATLLDAVGAAYRAIAKVGTAGIVSREDDGSLRTYAYHGQQYYGFEMRVTVEETTA